MALPIQTKYDHRKKPTHQFQTFPKQICPKIPPFALFAACVLVIFCFNVLFLSFSIDAPVDSFNSHMSEIWYEAQEMIGVTHKDSYVWVSEVDQVTYKRLHTADADRYGVTSEELENQLSIGMDWAEIQGKEIKFYFKGTLIGGYQVLLQDDVRDITLKLSKNECSHLVTHVSNDPKKKTKESLKLLYGGRWTVFDGEQVDGSSDDYDDDTGSRKPPPPRHEASQHPTATIIVLLAAYRDPLCGNTLYELFSNAKYPDRISASVAQQNDPTDPLCLEAYCKLDPACRREQVTIISVPLENARGVMPARFHQLLGIRKEEFCLQIDAHSVFEDDWDIIALEDWFSIGNEMAVMTTYPNRAKDKHRQHFSPARCSTKFSHAGQLVHGGNSAHNVKPGATPFLVPFFGAGIAFSKCHANLNVPYDPYMSFLFGGEEFNRAVRLFTWGYDMYAPKRNFVYHYYDDDLKDDAVYKPSDTNFKKRDRGFFSDKNHLGEQTTLRWRKVLGLPIKHGIKEALTVDLDLFGLGSRRTLQQYLDFAGVDLLKSEETSRCNRLGRMKWVAYDYPEPFWPSGEGCQRSAYECCNSLYAVRAVAEHFLTKTNEEVSVLVKQSPIADQAVQSKSLPYISPLALSPGPLPCTGPVAERKTFLGESLDGLASDRNQPVYNVIDS